jgi:glycosyltransferase involved in cell wall biosynthesis
MHLDQRFGGIAASLPRFCEALTQTGRFTSRLIALCNADEVAPESYPADTVIRLPSGRLRWVWDSRLHAELGNAIRQSSVVHIHGLWQEHSAAAARLCRQLGKPYLVSAHGMLEPWALNRAKWKKKAYFGAVEGNVLRRAVALRALTQAELTFYRNLGLSNPIEVLPNGVDLPLRSSPHPFLEAFPYLADRRLIIFLGRVHPKKGLDILFRAWAQVRTGFPGAHLVVAGPDEDQTVSTLVSIARDLGIENQITFTGMLRGPLKWSALSAASAFVLPSHSEGFSVSVLEALGSGLPVIVSRACYFPEVVESGCGWEIEPNESELVRTLSDALSMPPPTLSEMGRRGRVLAETSFSWTAIGQRAADILERSSAAQFTQ